MTSQKPSVANRLYNLLFYSVVSLIVVFAVLVSIARVLLSNVDSYRQDIEALASIYVERVVKIESLDARFVGFTPTLVLKNVRLMDPSAKHNVMAFDEARVGLSLPALWQSHRLIPAKVVIEGAELVVTRKRDGKLSVQGINMAELGGEQGMADAQDLSSLLFERTDLAMQNSVIVFNDRMGAKRKLRFEHVNLHLQNNGEQHSLRGFVDLPKKYGKRLDFAISMRGNVQLPQSWQGKFYINARAVDLHQWNQVFPAKKFNFHHGQGNLSLWVDVDAGHIERVSGDVMLTELNLDLDILYKPLKLKFAGGLFDYKRNTDGWAVAVDRFQMGDDKRIWPVSRFNIQGRQLAGMVDSAAAEKTQPAVTEIELIADYFRLEDVASLARKTRLLPKKIRNWLGQARPAGDVSQFSLRIHLGDNVATSYQLQTKFKQLSARADGEIPGMHGVSGELWLDSTHGKLHLASDFSTWKYPQMFSRPLVMTKLDATLNWQRHTAGWQVWSDEVIVRNADIETRSQFQLDIPTDVGETFVDLQVGFANGNASHAKRYFPYSVMTEGLAHWLKQGSISGEVTGGGAVFRGRLSDFPYLEPKGQFLVEFSARNMGVDYLAGWPMAQKAKLEARFDSKGLLVKVKSFTILSTRAQHVSIRLADYQNAQLILDGELSGPVNDLALFLVNTPIQPQGKGLLAQSSITGKAATKLHIEIPLTERIKKVSPLSFQGEVAIQNGGLSLWNKQIEASEINGTVFFSEKDESARSVKGKLFGHAAEFDLFASFEDNVESLTLVTSSHIDAQQLMQRLGQPSQKRISGSTDWQGVLRFRRAPGGSMQIADLQLRSSLEGIRLDLPAPLNKKTQEVRELSTTLTFQPQQQVSVLAKYHNSLSGSMRLADSKLAGLSLHFGPDPVPLPDKAVIRISGNAEHIELSAWRKAMLDLFPSHAEKGSVLPVELDMASLNIIEEPKTAAERAPPTRVESFPLLSGHIDHLTYHGFNLGKLSIHTSRMHKGIKLDFLELQAATHHIKSVGNWRQGLLGDTSHADVMMKSDDLGKLLETLGYSAVIKGGRFDLQGSFAWPDSPMAFSLGQAMGTLHMDVRDGRMTDVEAGAGRLLGLFSLAALPRRLGLDFKDTFQSGFSFDEMSGDFKVKDGSAFTSNLVTKSPVATIEIEGRTGYVARDFDQHVTVIPQVGDTLPVTGALLFGLEIGAAIALIDTLMGKQIDKANRREYNVTGSWDEPKITEIDSDPDEEAQVVDFDEDTD